MFKIVSEVVGRPLDEYILDVKSHAGLRNWAYVACHRGANAHEHFGTNTIYFDNYVVLYKRPYRPPSV
jgi:hypothetical protein